jgi:hypothetical protein
MYLATHLYMSMYTSPRMQDWRVLAPRPTLKDTVIAHRFFSVSPPVNFGRNLSKSEVFHFDCT